MTIRRYAQLWWQNKHPAIRTGQGVFIMPSFCNWFSLFVIIRCHKQRPVYLVWLHLQLLLLANKTRIGVISLTGQPSIFRSGLSWWWCCIRDWVGVFKHCILSSILHKLLNQINLIVAFTRSCKKPSWGGGKKKTHWCKHIDLWKLLYRSWALILYCVQNVLYSKTARVRQESRNAAQYGSSFFRYFAVTPNVLLWM